MQSRTASFIESLLNVAIGFGVSYASNLVILPLFGFMVNASQAFSIGVIFTVISIIRSYFVRRLFNRLGVRNASASN
jgi:hypothetical protein